MNRALIAASVFEDAKYGSGDDIGFGISGF